MPLIILAVLAGGGLGFGLYKGSDNITRLPGEAIKENAIPLAAIAASTFLLFSMLKKSGKAA